jgi:argininosuccinate lyase
MKAWGGRFREVTHPLVEGFTSSIGFDWILYPYDLEGSRAYAEMLERIGILSREEKETILTGLDEIEREIEEGRFSFSEALEDIHMHIEQRLTEKIGDTAKRLHTGRSRNDQVMTDVKLYLKDALCSIDGRLFGLLRAILRKADEEKATIMPGYTHLQRAQIVTFGHYLLAHYVMLKRDRERLRFVMSHTADTLPLGSSALAGSTIPLDREFLKERLGFSRLSENSIDAVSERDSILDALYETAMIMLHLSRLSQDLILFCTEEFSFVELPDSLCTGSSLMPHKKNPDALELIRGKTSRVIADLFSLFLVMKGLPLAYNRDLQEDKEPLFHAIKTAEESLSVMELCVRDMKVNRRRMEKACYEGCITATEMAEYLVLKGVPFREAHKIVGGIVRSCVQKGKGLLELTLEELKGHSLHFDKDVFDYVDPVRIVHRRKTIGGASVAEVERFIEQEKPYLGL